MGDVEGTYYFVVSVRVHIHIRVHVRVQVAEGARRGWEVFTEAAVTTSGQAMDMADRATQSISAKLSELHPSTSPTRGPVETV